jgi:CDP-6-deoxy-D-xylo-4-hexulose-3-dehydrase
MSTPAPQLRAQILELVAQYHEAAFAPRAFVPGQTPIPPSGKVFDADELCCLTDSALDFWLTTGRFAEQFEKSLAQFFGVRHALLTNSGSSSNLVALSALTSPKLGKAQLRPGDEVLTVAAGFPTTVNPIVQNGMVPVFLDVTLPDCNLDVSQLESARSERTRAVMIAHTLGNPFDLETIAAFCREHKLYLIEDCCDALGAKFNGKLVGTFGELATVSFYPAHHITTGEGGCVVTNKPLLKTMVESFRDWGRDCWCAPGFDNTCGKRFDWHLADLPAGYDHKYIYSHVGYNLKMTDMQAAVGCAQFEKLPGFIATRQKNFQFLRERLESESVEKFIMLPKAHELAEPSWFGFMMIVREGAPFARRDLVEWLESRKIGTRLLFGGNLTKQPLYQDVKFRTVGELKNTDRVMDGAFWIGLYPGLSEEMLEYSANSIREFCAKF